jgi:hypothetical protein
MQINELSFGNIKIDGISYSEDIIIDKCKIIARDKSASRKIKGQFGHTPLSPAENIPWNCKRLVIGSGMYGSLPVMKEVHDKAKELNIELLIKPTPQAVDHLNETDTNFILHLTC